jgi:hypothetical protein
MDHLSAEPSPAPAQEKFGAQADFVKLISIRSGMVKNECTAW